MMSIYHTCIPKSRVPIIMTNLVIEICDLISKIRKIEEPKLRI